MHLEDNFPLSNAVVFGESQKIVSETPLKADRHHKTQAMILTVLYGLWTEDDFPPVSTNILF